MSDIVERARREGSGRGELDGDGTDALLLELAAEIERLRTDNERLKAALRGMVRCYGNHDDPETAEARAIAIAVLKEKP